MFDACICVDYDEGPEFWSSAIRTARKPHRCCECRGTINAGDQYEYYVGKWDGDFMQYHTCLTCLRIRDSLFKCGHVFTCMWEEIHDAYCGWGDDDEMECICPT